MLQPAISQRWGSENNQTHTIRSISNGSALFSETLNYAYSILILFPAFHPICVVLSELVQICWFDQNPVLISYTAICSYCVCVLLKQWQLLVWKRGSLWSMTHVRMEDKQLKCFLETHSGLGVMACSFLLSNSSEVSWVFGTVPLNVRGNHHYSLLAHLWQLQFDQAHKCLLQLNFKIWKICFWRRFFWGGRNNKSPHYCPLVSQSKWC